MRPEYERNPFNVSWFSVENEVNASLGLID